jgi:hypothetical protein
VCDWYGGADDGDRDPLTWEFTGEALLTRFFDNDGNLLRIQVQVRESGTVTNLATGEVVDLPRIAFTERVIFVEDGSIIIEDVDCRFGSPARRTSCSTSADSWCASPRRAAAV